MINKFRLSSILLIILILSGCNKEDAIISQTINNATTINYELNNEMRKSPIDFFSKTDDIYPDVDKVLRGQWLEHLGNLSIASSIKARRTQFNFQYDEKDQLLKWIPEDQLSKVTGKEQQLYKLSIYLLSVAYTDSNHKYAKAVVGSYEWSSPLPSKLSENPATYLGVRGDAAIAEVKGMFRISNQNQPAIESDYIMMGKYRGVGFEEQRPLDEPIMGSFLIKIYQNQNSELEGEQFIVSLPSNNKNQYSYQFSDKEGTINIYSNSGKILLPVAEINFRNL